MLVLVHEGMRITALFLTLAFGITVVFSERSSFRKHILIGFLMTLAGYLMAYWQPVQEHKPVFEIAFFLATSLPYAFWLLSKSLFDDEFEWTSRFWLLTFMVPILLNVLYRLNELYGASWYSNFRFLPYAISVLFIVLVIYEAVRSKDNDLVLSRLKNRNVFVVFSSFIALFSVYFFFAEDPMELPLSFETFQHFTISCFLFLFFYSQHTYISVFVVKLPIKSNYDANAVIRSRIIEKITLLVEQDKIFTQEGLTITQLSEMLDEKEYQVRKAINDELEYTNFNAFLNHYRIVEACQILQDNRARELTFQEIAYRMGYQSVATFNRAFKRETGQTPSEYVAMQD